MKSMLEYPFVTATGRFSGVICSHGLMEINTPFEIIGGEGSSSAKPADGSYGVLRGILGMLNLRTIIYDANSRLTAVYLPAY